MTTLYRPVLIESAEQAEALPEGTIMFLPAGPHVWTARDPGGEFLDHYGRPWHFENTQDDEPFTALVPIEAEEETSVVVRASGFRDIAAHPYSEASMDSDGNVWFGEGLSRVDVTEQFNEWAKQHTRTRYVTPWEEA